MKLRLVYAVRSAYLDVERAWLIDTCAGGTWSANANDAVTFASPDAAVEALAAAEIDSDGYGYQPLTIVPVTELARSAK